MILGMMLAAGARLAALHPEPFALPGGGQPIGFDDMQFSPALHRLVVPAGRTGTIVLVDPDSHAVTTIGGFSAAPAGGRGHGEGTTSADTGHGLLFAIDRTAKTVDVVDPDAGTILSKAPLGGSPDYVRFVAPTGELWVTEPDGDRIEVFSLGKQRGDAPKLVGTIAVTGGPESLVVDGARGRAYANLWSGTTLAIDLKTRVIVARWPNGCMGSRGLALDAAQGHLFVACSEGKAVVLDAGHDGTVLDTAPAGAGIDIIAFDSGTARLYVPGAKAATLTVFAVSQSGKLSALALAPTTEGAHCVAVDDRHGVWICDPAGGRLLHLHP